MKRDGNIQNLKPFKKGQSGNLKGRPRKLPELDKLLDEVMGQGAEGKSVAKQILDALAKKAKGGDVKAAEMLLDRAYGKIKQPIENSGNQELTIKIVRSRNKSE